MRVPLSWLKEYVDVVVEPEALAQVLTLAGLEVAAIDYVGVAAPSGSQYAPNLSEAAPPEYIPWDPERILVGEILEVKQHPNADRLTVPVIGYGEGRSIEVVTGAPNIRPGMQGEKVALALGGARLIDGHAETRQWLTLKPSKLRGVRSEGMVCSELELGLSEEHEGILVLPPDAPVGVPLRDYLGEVVFDIDITPNIARALSIVGVAREVAALTGGGLRLPQYGVQTQGAPIEGRAGATIENPELCRRMTVGLIEGITIGPSPLWMQRRLRLVGMRPINNIVDVSNYVMLEWGEPTHAFDADRVADQHLIVRLAHAGEQLRTLDQQERVMTPDRLLIADRNGALSVAGVMGGFDSEVSATTTRVLLEAAAFDPVTIRRSAQALKLPSEASRRFERGVDPELPPLAQRRCLQLMQQVAGGTVAQGIIDVYPNPPLPLELELTPAEVRRILGIDLTVAQISDYLLRLGFGCQVVGDAVQVTVPSYRLDVSVPADLIEEVARLYGYHKLPSTRLQAELPVLYTNAGLTGERIVKEALVNAGLFEVISYSMTDRPTITALAGREPDLGSYLKLTNPLNPERSILRRELLPELLQIGVTELRQHPSVRLYEVGRVFEPAERKLLPAEPRRLAVVMAGARAPLTWQQSETGTLDFFDLKGVIEALLLRLHVDGVEWVRAEDPRFHPGRSALVQATVDGTPQTLGVVGELHPETRRRLDIPAGRTVVAAELDLDGLFALRRAVRYRSVVNQPAVYQDLAITAPIEVPAARIQAIITANAGPTLEAVQLFDQYTGAPIPEGQRSLTFRLTFRAPDRTLADTDVNKIRDRVVQRLGAELGATLRGE